MSASGLSAEAPAKLNLALVVGPVTESGKHEVVTVIQVARACRHDRGAPCRRGRCRRVSRRHDRERGIARARGCNRPGSGRDDHEARAGRGGPRWWELRCCRRATPGQRAPREARSSTSTCLQIAARLGADVPFFLGPSQQLGEGDGTELTPLRLPDRLRGAPRLAGGQPQGVDRGDLPAVRPAGRGCWIRRAAAAPTSRARDDHATRRISRGCRGTTSTRHPLAHELRAPGCLSRGRHRRRPGRLRPVPRLLRPLTRRPRRIAGRGARRG